MTTRQSMFMMAVAALALGWAPTAAAYQVLPRTGQTTCYKLERYLTVGHPLEGEAVVYDAAGLPEFDLVSGEADPRL